jgi:hypothetical protein
MFFLEYSLMETQGLNLIMETIFLTRGKLLEQLEVLKVA